MTAQLRDYQQAGVDDAVQWCAESAPGALRCYASPTGSGKSYVEAEILRRVERSYLVAPTDDILIGIARKRGSSATRKKELEALNLYTPIRFRNAVVRGEVDPALIIGDEGHHWEANTFDEIRVMAPKARVILFTATPMRGTARSTREFLETWGAPQWLITLREAVDAGIITFPRCDVVPLMDDDVISVRAGEFVVEEVNDALENIVERVTKLVAEHWTAPLMVCLPSVYAAEFYTAQLRQAGTPAVCITGDTPVEEREGLFRGAIDMQHVLCQVRVVSEGVDYPFRVAVDLAPTMSPVRFMQGPIGRITRPGGESRYIGCNRNLLRHAYLFDGLLPPGSYVAAEQCFPVSSRRATRVIGFESLGKFAPIDVPLYNGTTGQLVCITRVKDSVVTEYAAIASPLHSDVVYAERQNLRRSDGTAYGKWKQIDAIPDLDTGYTSVFNGELSEKQRAWWKRSARWYGLDPEAEVGTRSFVSLCVLKDIGARFRM